MPKSSMPVQMPPPRGIVPERVRILAHSSATQTNTNIISHQRVPRKKAKMRELVPRVWATAHGKFCEPLCDVVSRTEQKT